MKLLTVYAPDGTAHEVSNLNAIDLTRHSGFSFKNPVAAETAVEIVPTETTTKPVEVEVAPSADEPVTFATLEEEAMAVADEPDVAKYLASKDGESLRTLAEKRYGEKVHARTGKDKLIEKIIGWEEAMLAAGDE